MQKDKHDSIRLDGDAPPQSADSVRQTEEPARLEAASPQTKSPSEDSTGQPATLDDGSTPATAQETPKCGLNLNKLNKDFREQHRKELESLKTRLKYPVVGSNISAAYIQEHNQKIQQLYDSYAEKARQHHCNLQFPLPSPLTDDFSG